MSFSTFKFAKEEGKVQPNRCEPVPPSGLSPGPLLPCRSQGGQACLRQPRAFWTSLLRNTDPELVPGHGRAPRLPPPPRTGGCITLQGRTSHPAPKPPLVPSHRCLLRAQEPDAPGCCPRMLLWDAALGCHTATPARSP